MITVAVVGATGQVGAVMRRLLEERDFPVDIFLARPIHRARRSTTNDRLDVIPGDLRRHNAARRLGGFFGFLGICHARALKGSILRLGIDFVLVQLAL